ncbi:hypothetical protein B0H16DRAFT_123499, partial [Mycena metata]
VFHSHLSPPTHASTRIPRPFPFLAALHACYAPDSRLASSRDDRHNARARRDRQQSCASAGVTLSRADVTTWVASRRWHWWTRSAGAVCICSCAFATSLAFVTASAHTFSFFALHLTVLLLPCPPSLTLTRSSASHAFRVLLATPFYCVPPNGVSALQYQCAWTYAPSLRPTWVARARVRVIGSRRHLRAARTSFTQRVLVGVRSRARCRRHLPSPFSFIPPSSNPTFPFFPHLLLLLPFPPSLCSKLPLLAPILTHPPQLLLPNSPHRLLPTSAREPEVRRLLRRSFGWGI